MKKRLLAIVLSIMLVVCAIPFTFAQVSAAAPAVEIIDGQRTVFLSGFGRMNYQNETKTAFRTFEEALSALGTEGGRICFSGTLNLAEWQDTPGRGPLTFEGVGNKVSGSKLDFGAKTEVHFLGDTYVSNLMLVTQKDVPIVTNGHVFASVGNIECNYTEKFVDGGHNTITYNAPFVFAVGNYSGENAGEVTLSAGHYALVAAGSLGPSNVSGTTNFNIAGGEHSEVYSGNYFSTGTFSGTSNLTVSGGNVAKLVAGSESGTTNANLNVTVSGGEITRFFIGSENGSAVGGNVFIALYDGVVKEFVNAKNNIAGKVIIVDGTKNKNIIEGSYDYLITADGVKIEPFYTGLTLSGFSVYDENGFIPTKVFANGTEIAGVNGVYSLPEGKVSVSCESAGAVSPNKEASYVAGYEDGTFKPQNNITRAEAVTMLARIINPDISALSSIVHCDYADVAATDWYMPVIGYFQSLGYLEKLAGTGNTISPKQNITRGEFAELSRHIITALYNGKEFGIKLFPDVPDTNPYYDSIGQLGYLGVIGGYEDGTFKPDANITRAEAVTMVNRFLGRVPTGNAGATVFFDIDSHWAKSQIIAACNPAQSAGNTIWTLANDITVGSFELLSGDVTVGDQIRNLYNKIPEISEKDAIAGIDAISKWQINNIINSESKYPETGKKFYISPNGNDANDGLSPETAWKTMEPMSGIKGMKLIKPGDTVLFERGGEWRGVLSCIAGVTYSAYGEGPKPVFNASKKNYADPALWTPTEYPNIYKLSDKLVNCGLAVFDFTGELGNYNELVGTLRLKGLNGVEGYSDLKDDLEFYNDLSTNDFYLYSAEGNPGERFDSIEIAHGTNSTSIPQPGNVTLDNLNFRFCGQHGVGVGGHKNITVRNCIFDYLGGSVLRGFHGVNTTRYGNALQVYGSCDGWYLYDNWIYQIYDTGVTHQYNTTYDPGNATMDHVDYIGNVIEYCHWSIEYYNPDYGNTYHTFHNTHIADNICRMNGYGWGTRIRGAVALFQSAGITENTENFVTENNIFDRGKSILFNCNSVGDRELQLRNNIYVQNLGGKFATFFGATFNADENTKTKLKNHADDTTSHVLFNNDTTITNYPG
ncbi:MAG: S-layer homology domain-containing protein [Clostridia bacterium]|nr:S-layer homology domain-containing protein [Clostridia bacterium]